MSYNDEQDPIFKGSLPEINSSQGAKVTSIVYVFRDTDGIFH